MDQVQQIEKPQGEQVTVYTLQEVCGWITQKYGHNYYQTPGLDGAIKGYIVVLLRVMFARSSQGLIEFKQSDLDISFQAILAETSEKVRKDLVLFSQFVEDLLDEFGGEQKRVFIWNYKGVIDESDKKGLGI